MRKILFVLFLLPTMGFAQTVSKEDYVSGKEILEVPPGNRLRISPEIPATWWQSLVRATYQTPEASFTAALRMFSKNKLAPVLDQVAPLYGVTPLQMIAAIIGEHTFNTGIADYGQGFYMDMAKGWVKEFNSNNISLQHLLRQPPFQACNGFSTSYEIWQCYQEVWWNQYRGRNGFPNKSLKFAFFNPIKAGHTFGIGQLDPMRALMSADTVSRVLGKAPITIDDPASVYSAILNNETNPHYIAATLATFIQTYRAHAHVDISKNIGIIATLYNLGNERQKALALFNKNSRLLEQGKAAEWPVENYYGWFVNSKEQVLRKWLKDNGSTNPN